MRAFACFVIVGLVGCSGSDDGGASQTSDSGVASDTSTGGDTAKADTFVADTSNDLGVDSARDSTSTDTGSSVDSSCVACVPGATEVNPCGNCGTRTTTCSAACVWVDGVCTGEGVCAVGATETDTTGCASGSARTRTCSSTCNWGAYTPCSTTGWFDMANAPSGPYIGVINYDAVWTGSVMLVTSGFDPAVSYSDSKSLTAYDPMSDAWTSLTDFPLAAREGGAVVWSGAEMIVWGGDEIGVSGDGAFWSPATSTWTTIATTGAPSKRRDMAAVWSTTTNEMIVWGGVGSGTSGGTAYFTDGARYKPSASGGTWSTMSSPPSTFLGRSTPMVVWTGTQMVVFGGDAPSCTPTDSHCADAAAYDPSTDTWTVLPSPAIGPRWHGAVVASGSSAIFWGGVGGSAASTYYDDGTIWNGTTFTKIAATASGAPSVRANPFAWSIGGDLYVFGGDISPSSELDGTGKADGGQYDPTTGKWTALPALNAPTGRCLGHAIWTGTEAIVWGGSGRDGKRYRP
jgi:N-acetylneuraminic acid mutarotase